MTKRVYNFSAGPAVLPVPVLEEIQQNLMSLPGVGMSVLEISHRSGTFQQIIDEADTLFRKLLSVSDDYEILFLQGGATMQFSMVPANLMIPDKGADYVLTGTWSQKALKEAKKVGTARTSASSEKEGFNRIPAQGELEINPSSSYLHYTSNNTIFGTEFDYVPDAGSVPLVVDVSSDFLSRPFDVARHGLIYAGAQKNVGPAGVTVVLIRKDLLERVPANLPTMMDYGEMAKGKSLLNTPPTFCIYAVGLVLKWIDSLGGLAEMEKRNIEKAQLLYSAIDGSSGYYRGHAKTESRSRMNIPFRLPSEDLEKKFLKEATAAGFDGLKGHRSVGGLRASIYNAFPKEGVEALVSFMKEFQTTNG